LTALGENGTFRAVSQEVALDDSPSDDPAAPDDALLEAAQRGDRSAFERLYERHGARMKSIAANLLGSVSDAEDAVQETFLKVHRGAAAFRGGARFSTWVYRILLNSCYDQIRRRKRKPEIELAPDGTPAARNLPAAAADHPLRLELEDAVARLGERPRTAFLMSAVEGLSHREVAEVLGISETASRSLVFEARRELQRMLWRGRAPEARA
jgi:RNA polymerase sigma-70 factor (ECF subfamily)